MASLFSLSIFISSSQLAYGADYRNFTEATENLRGRGLLRPTSLDQKSLPYLKVVDQDPDYALAGVRVFAERRLTSVAKTVSDSKPVPTGMNNLLSYLQMKKAIKSDQANALFKLNTWLNEAAHGSITAKDNADIRGLDCRRKPQTYARSRRSRQCPG